VTRSQQTAADISTHLMTGMHHSTPEGRAAMAAIVARALAVQAEEQARFWTDCMRDALRDKDLQIARLTTSS
jgi:hypothetical protein